MISAKLKYATILLCLSAWGPFYRSTLDRLWVLEGGLSSVGQWAQLQTLMEFIVAPIGAGIAVGLSIFTTQHRHADHPIILCAGYFLSLAIISPFLLVTIFYSKNICIFLGLNIAYQKEVILSGIAGYLGIGVALLSNFFIGRNQQGKSLGLMLVTGAPIILLLTFFTLFKFDYPIKWVLYSIIVVGLTTNGLLIFFLYRSKKLHKYTFTQLSDYCYKLARFIPAGLAIGILSPLCVLIVRSMIAQQQDWRIAGVATALWRVSDWVLSWAITMLYFHFLPMLSYDSLQGKIKIAIKKITIQIFLPSLLALLLLCIFRSPVLHFLYGEKINISLDISLYFWLGEALRILSAIYLMGLFVLHATKMIAIWDFFSQPLFSFLLFSGMASSLELTGLAFLLTYLLYAALCILGFIYVEKNHRALTLTLT